MQKNTKQENVVYHIFKTKYKQEDGCVDNKDKGESVEGLEQNIKALQKHAADCITSHLQEGKRVKYVFWW